MVHKQASLRSENLYLKDDSRPVAGGGGLVAALVVLYRTEVNDLLSVPLDFK